jgi:hypothetical protein
MIAIGLDEKAGAQLYDSAILLDKTDKLLWKHRKINVLPWLMTPPYAEGRAKISVLCKPRSDPSRC